MSLLSDVTYQDGWFDEEYDGVHLFRWMSGEAHCRIADLPTTGVAWLRVVAGHGWPASSLPVLSVSVDGRPASRHAIRREFCEYLLPLGQTSGVADVTFALDRTSRAAGDPRELGIMVREIAVIDLASAQTPLDAGGWYDWERHEYFPFRWMGAEGRLLLPAQVWQRGRFAAVPIYTDVEDGQQTLTVSMGPDVLAEMRLTHGWHVHDFLLPAHGPEGGAETVQPLELTFRVNRLLPPGFNPSDPREISIRVGELEVHDDARRHERARVFAEAAREWFTDVPACAPASKAGAFDRISPLVRAWRDAEAYLPEGGEGWHGWEFQDHIPFRWMTLKSHIHVPADSHRGRRFCMFPIYSDYEDLSQVATISTGGLTRELPLVHKWAYYSFAFGQQPTEDLEIAFRVNKLMPAINRHQTEVRELTVRIGPMMFHDDEARHERARFSYENAVLNLREFLAGATTLTSFPLDLGIDLFSKCNIKPPCVYCPWDSTKKSEGENTAVVVDDGTLEEYGPFFQAARALVNCSFGEPLLHPRLQQILDFTARHEKVVELSTNGQAFTPATVAALAGKPVVLYVSLDAASAEVYGRLRNDRWHEVITGLTFLREARRRFNGLPKLNMVFMPMRANLRDLEAYFRLCRMVDADLLVLRPLNYGETATSTVDRGGYRFEYARELLTLDELQAVAERCEEYSAKYEILVGNQFDFGKVKQPGIRRKQQGANGEAQQESR
jgi:MoaA/NifB/PqqE/SkfB family radical SAM enzyme